MTEHQSPGPTFLVQVSTGYSDSTTARALVQLIPVVGGSIDTIFAGPGNQWQRERIESFFSMLNQRIREIENYEHLPPVAPNQPLFDFIVNVLNYVVKTRSIEKHASFTHIIKNTISHGFSWDEADIVARIVNDLSDSHIAILKEIASAPECSGYQNKRMVSLRPQAAGMHQSHQPLVLSLRVPSLSIGNLKYLCAELSAKGLIEDQAGLYIDTGANEMYTVSEFGLWFISRIQR